jgi:hypothetical protein
VWTFIVGVVLTGGEPVAYQRSVVKNVRLAGPAATFLRR